MNIAIMGFRGTGKTTVCRLLAGELGKNLVMSEEETLKVTGSSMEKFIRKNGWDKFRELEYDAVEKLSALDDCIFELGSDIVMRNENVINLKKNSILVLLTANPRTISERLSSGQKYMDRQDLAHESKELLREIEERFNKSADYTINTSGMSPQDVCNLVAHYARQELQ